MNYNKKESNGNETKLLIHIQKFPKESTLTIEVVIYHPTNLIERSFPVSQVIFHPYLENVILYECATPVKRFLGDSLVSLPLLKTIRPSLI